jgi:hypothetical protein
MSKTTLPTPTRGLTGPRTLYRNKVKAPFNVLLTATARKIVETDCASGSRRVGTFKSGRTGLRPADYVEYLIRHFGAQVPTGLMDMDSADATDIPELAKARARPGSRKRA